MRSRGTEDQHHKITDEDDGVPVVEMDFLHDNKKEDQKIMPSLDVVDRDSPAMCLVPLPGKQATEYTIATVIDFVDNELTHEKIILQSDVEPALKVIAEKIKDKRT